MKYQDRLKIAGKELMRLNVGNAMKSLVPTNQTSEIIASSNYKRGGTDNKFWFFGADGVDSYFEVEGAGSLLKLFKNCPPLSSIIFQKAQAYINGETVILNNSGKAKDKEATGLQATQIKKLLSQPNPYQSGDQFEAFTYINTMIYGYTIILPVKPNGFENYDATSLWAVPGEWIEVEESADPFNKEGAKIIQKVTMVYKNRRTPLPIDDILIITDFGLYNNSIALPESRVKLVRQPACNIIGALESRGVLIANRGPRFLISAAGGKDVGGYTSLTPLERDDVEQQFNKKYGLLRSQTQAIISSAALSVGVLGFDVKQLGLYEEVADSSSMLCMGLGFPKFLAGLSDPTFNNQATAEKALYQRFIIPEAKNFYGQLNRWLQTEKYSIRIEKDYRKMDVLQEDKATQALARKTLNEALKIEFDNGLITINDWLIKLGENPLPDELGNVRATDPKNSSVPLAVTIGVGGVQGLIEVLVAQGVSEDAKQATLEIIFGIAAEDAARMVVSNGSTNQNDNTQQNT